MGYSGNYSVTFSFANNTFSGKPKVKYKINAPEPYYSYIQSIIKDFW